jgi:hypothetical protein
MPLFFAVGEPVHCGNVVRLKFANFCMSAWFAHGSWHQSEKIPETLQGIQLADSPHYLESGENPPLSILLCELWAELRLSWSTNAVNNKAQLLLRWLQDDQSQEYIFQLLQREITFQRSRIEAADRLRNVKEIIWNCNGDRSGNGLDGIGKLPDSR